jgi:hypothetical protein
MKNSQSGNASLIVIFIFVLMIGAAYYYSNILTPTPARKTPVSFKQCKTSHHWGSQPVPRGTPGDPIIVYGCIPNSCPTNQYSYIDQVLTGNWPDGTLKASFICDFKRPPAA